MRETGNLTVADEDWFYTSRGNNNEVRVQPLTATFLVQPSIRTISADIQECHVMYMLPVNWVPSFEYMKLCLLKTQFPRRSDFPMCCSSLNNVFPSIHPPGFWTFRN